MCGIMNRRPYLLPFTVGKVRSAMTAPRCDNEERYVSGTLSRPASNSVRGIIPLVRYGPTEYLQKYDPVARKMVPLSAKGKRRKTLLSWIQMNQASQPGIFHDFVLLLIQMSPVSHFCIRFSVKDALSTRV